MDDDFFGASIVVAVVGRVVVVACDCEAPLECPRLEEELLDEVCHPQLSSPSYSSSESSSSESLSSKE